MAAPVAAKVTLPTDAGNTGSKVRTQTRVVGADTVHEHFFIPISKESKLGVYAAAYNGTVVAAAHTFGTSGFFWLHNPVGSAVKVRIRRINVLSNIATSLSTPTCPRIAFTRFSLTGTASGATLTPAKRATADAAAVGSLRTAITGMALTTQGDIFYALPPVAVGTAAWAAVPPTQEELVLNDEDGYIVLAAGEGICCWQADAGSTSDTRKFMVNIGWEEIE